jgi:hypothetical protein
MTEVIFETVHHKIAPEASRLACGKLFSKNHERKGEQVLHGNKGVASVMSNSQGGMGTRTRP